MLQNVLSRELIFMAISKIELKYNYKIITSLDLSFVCFKVTTIRIALPRQESFEPSPLGDSLALSFIGFFSQLI